MKKDVSLTHQITSICLFLMVLFAGLFLPILQGKPDNALPVELIMFLSATVISSYILIFTKMDWDTLFASMVSSVSDALPGLLILIVIGPLIAGFIMSGLMPMLVYYGIKLINPSLIYASGFILAGLFSTFTGTSWGSAATIGVVMIGICNAIGANNPIMAGAIVGGAYFGDKMSPLSDTTNLSSIASKVNLYDHIGSMMWTTIPSSLIALGVYVVCGQTFPCRINDISDPSIVALLNDLSSIFNFNILLLIPLIVVLVGSIMKKPVLPVMVLGSLLAFSFALIFQNFTVQDVLWGMHKGFSLNMVTWTTYTPAVEGQPFILGFFQRGGFWELAGLLPISTSILCVVGVLSSIDAMPATVNRLFGWVKSRSAIIISSLFTAIALIGITANGIACSFVTADIFRKKYDDNKISRRVLSRCTEDAGTLLEVLFPWTPAAIFFTKTLGVSVWEFLPWSVMNWSTSFVAIFLALTGIGTYKNLPLDNLNGEKDGAIFVKEETK